ncbi:MAG TPA: VOC family protein [Stellaceae bacterium]|nr:VOC family protein [Stellaceae bacterium]
MSANNVVAWFEIPAGNLDRAVAFYEKIFAKTLKREAFGPLQMAVFPYQQPGVSGAVVQGAPYQPGQAKGTVIYLDCDGQIDAVLSRVASAGGEIAMAKTELPGNGAFAHILDTEGNRVGLHAR